MMSSLNMHFFYVQAEYVIQIIRPRSVSDIVLFLFLLLLGYLHLHDEISWGIKLKFKLLINLCFYI